MLDPPPGDTDHPDGRPEDPPVRAANPRAPLPFFPAIEGLRGLAVAGVLGFHSGAPLLQGGYLGVSTFFTLSGFLITGVLLRGHATTGTVALQSFWSRRLRRLLPAALLALLLAVAFGATAGDPRQRQNLGGDAFASLGYAANWRFLLSGESYGDLFATPSPVLHFWSIAIEEQYYVAFPLLVLAVVGAARWSLRRFGLLLAGLVAVSTALSVILRGDADRVYFGTDTRAAEILVGALLAVVVADRARTSAAGSGRSADGAGQPEGARAPASSDRAMAWVGAAALVAMVALWIATPRSSAWVTGGGLTAYAVLSAAVVHAATLPAGPVHLLLSWTPVRTLGLVSYGVYLYHWPIRLWLLQGPAGLTGGPLFGVGTAITLLVAGLSYRFLELPLRRGRPLARTVPALRFDRVVVVGVAAVALSAVAVTVTAPASDVDFAAAEARLERTGSPPGSTRTGRPDGSIPQLTAYGDSVLLSSALGLGDVLAEQGRAEIVRGQAELGCGLGVGGKRKSAGVVEDVPAQCNGWPERWKAEIDRLELDIAVVQESRWDMCERLLPGDSVWRTFGDPVYDAYIEGLISTTSDLLHSRGAEVVWLTALPMGENAPKAKSPDLDLIGAPERYERFNALLRKVAASRTEWMHVVDLAAWVASTGEDGRLRADGVHFTEAAGREVAERFLADAVLTAAGY